MLRLCFLFALIVFTARLYAQPKSGYQTVQSLVTNSNSCVSLNNQGDNNTIYVNVNSLDKQVKEVFNGFVRILRKEFKELGAKIDRLADKVRRSSAGPMRDAPFSNARSRRRPLLPVQSD